MKFKAIQAMAILVASSVTAGAETVSAASIGHATANSQVVAISDSLVIVNALTNYTNFGGENSDSPLAGASGPCFGSILINAGVVSGGGLCHYTGTNGEVAVLSWTADGINAEGRTQGVWAVLGGTGIWATASGGGRFDAGADAAGEYTNNVTGEFVFE